MIVVLSPAFDGIPYLNFMFAVDVVGASDAVYTTGPDRFDRCGQLHVYIIREEL